MHTVDIERGWIVHGRIGPVRIALVRTGLARTDPVDTGLSGDIDLVVHTVDFPAHIDYSVHAAVSVAPAGAGSHDTRYRPDYTAGRIPGCSRGRHNRCTEGPQFYKQDSVVWKFRRLGSPGKMLVQVMRA